MRSKYLKKIIGFVLSIFFYLLLFPLLYFVRDFLGVEPSDGVFLIVQLVTFFLVYGIVAILIDFGLTLFNKRLMLLRKMKGGRDIVAEERHEDDESGIISLIPKD